MQMKEKRMGEIALRRFFLAVFCALALSLSALAADAALPSLEAAVNVREDGVCEVTMTAEVEFSAAVQELQIPLGTGAKDIVLSGWAYKKTTVDGATCLTLSNPAGFSGKQSFSCTYTLPSGVTETSSGQRFRLYAPQTGWEYAIGSMTLRVAFPAAVTTAPEWTSGYYEDIIDNYLKIDVTENTVTAQSIEALKDHETLQMDVQFPAGTFRVGNLPGKTAKLDTLLFFVLLLAVQLIEGVLTGFAAAWWSGEALTLFGLYATLPATAVILLFCRYARGRSPREIVGSPGRAWEYAVFAPLGVGLFAAAVGICAAGGALRVEPEQNFVVGRWLLFLVGFLLQGASEEILCRGYLMEIGRAHV